LALSPLPLSPQLLLLTYLLQRRLELHLPSLLLLSLEKRLPLSRLSSSSNWGYATVSVCVPACEEEGLSLDPTRTYLRCQSPSRTRAQEHRVYL
jgi:hypothetical protein